MKLRTVQLPPLHCYFVPLRPKYLPRHPVLEHPQSSFFYTVVTVHIGMTLINNQLDEQFLLYIFISIPNRPAYRTVTYTE